MVAVMVVPLAVAVALVGLTGSVQARVGSNVTLPLKPSTSVGHGWAGDGRPCASGWTNTDDSEIFGMNGLLQQQQNHAPNPSFVGCSDQLFMSLPPRYLPVDFLAADDSELTDKDITRMDALSCIIGQSILGSSRPISNSIMLLPPAKVSNGRNVSLDVEHGLGFDGDLIHHMKRSGLELDDMILGTLALSYFGGQRDLLSTPRIVHLNAHPGNVHYRILNGKINYAWPDFGRTYANSDAFGQYRNSLAGHFNDVYFPVNKNVNDRRLPPMVDSLRNMFQTRDLSTVRGSGFVLINISTFVNEKVSCSEVGDLMVSTAGTLSFGVKIFIGLIENLQASVGHLYAAVIELQKSEANLNVAVIDLQKSEANLNVAVIDLQRSEANLNVAVIELQKEQKELKAEIKVMKSEMKQLLMGQGPKSEL
jgi:hypothetical protein